MADSSEPLTTAGSTTAVLLAAGAGTRLGLGPKALLPFRGRTLVEVLADVLLDGGCREVVAVLGADAATVRAATDLSRHRVIDNPDWATGMGSSFRLGVAAAAPEDHVLIALVDQPGLTPETVARLLAAHRPGRVTAAAYRDPEGKLRRGHPLLWTPDSAPRPRKRQRATPERASSFRPTRSWSTWWTAATSPAARTSTPRTSCTSSARPSKPGPPSPSTPRCTGSQQLLQTALEPGPAAVRGMPDFRHVQAAALQAAVRHIPHGHHRFDGEQLRQRLPERGSQRRFGGRRRAVGQRPPGHVGVPRAGTPQQGQEVQLGQHLPHHRGRRLRRNSRSLRRQHVALARPEQPKPVGGALEHGAVGEGNPGDPHAPEAGRFPHQQHLRGAVLHFLQVDRQVPPALRISRHGVVEEVVAPRPCFHGREPVNKAVDGG